MRSIFPFFWRPTGVVSSLAELPVSGKVLAIKDVSLSVSGEKSGEHPLLVAELADGKIIGDLRLATTHDDVVIGGVQTVFACDDLPNHYALRRRRFRLPKYWRGKALLLGAANSDNYYHWLLESVPRWKMLLAADHREFDYVLLHGKSSGFQTEILDRMQVPAAKRLYLSRNYVHQFERLVVPAMPCPLWQVAPWVGEYVSSLFPGHTGATEKIYLTRRKARRRRLSNETELEKKLQAMGFILVQPEKMSVIEQARMFSSAKCVVAPHGAGLANMVFAPANALLVEIFHPSVLPPVYKNLAAARRLRYVGLIGKHAEKFPARNENETAFEIDVSTVIQALAENR